MTSAPETFGARLRAERERAGVSLDAIAQTTKIQRSLLVGLENNDVSQWPVGIFRRAFLRAYLGALGLRSEAIVAEFTRLFPESGGLANAERPERPGSLEAREVELRLRLAAAPSSTDLGAIGLGYEEIVAGFTRLFRESGGLRDAEQPERSGSVEAREGELRLRLAAAPLSTVRRVLLQAAASVSDLCIVFIIAAWTSVIFGFAAWPTLAIIGLTYYAVSGAWMGRTPGAWWFFREGPAARRIEPPLPVAAAPPLRIATARRRGAPTGHVALTVRCSSGGREAIATPTPVSQVKLPVLDADI